MGALWEGFALSQMELLTSSVLSHAIMDFWSALRSLKSLLAMWLDVERSMDAL